MTTQINEGVERIITCYQCDKIVTWLAPDSRCGDCTRLTPDEVRGVYTDHQQESQIEQ